MTGKIAFEGGGPSGHEGTGVTPKKPRYQAWQQDPVLVQQESETFPQIRAEARRVGATIYFADEAGRALRLSRGNHVGARGKDAGGGENGPTCFDQYDLGGERARRYAFHVLEGTVNGQRFKAFLQRPVADATCSVFLIVNGHPAHRTRLVPDYVESTEGRLRLFYLPPYASHLNPDETIWAHVKGDLAKRSIENLEQMKQLAIGALRRPQKLPRLVASFFYQPM